jgi:hypothetical protein
MIRLAQSHRTQFFHLAGALPSPLEQYGTQLQAGMWEALRCRYEQDRPHSETMATDVSLSGFGAAMAIMARSAICSNFHDFCESSGRMTGRAIAPLASFFSITGRVKRAKHSQQTSSSGSKARPSCLTSCHRPPPIQDRGQDQTDHRRALRRTQADRLHRLLLPVPGQQDDPEVFSQSSDRPVPTVARQPSCPLATITLAGFETAGVGASVGVFA